MARAESPSDSRSRTLFARARRLMPGGVSSPVRAFAAVGGTPPFMDRGEGAYLWDADDNRYIDFVMSWGPLIHGHAYPAVVRAVQEAAGRGTSFGAPTELEVDLARAVIDAMPSVEMVRFVNSGTEAAMSAVRLARAATGRDLILKFAGNYHGHADMLLVAAGSGALTLGIPTSPGVPESAVGTTLVGRYNDIAELSRVFETYGSRLAAVLVEPVAGNMGVVPPVPGFLEALSKLAQEYGALLICDEVITGFRVSSGGAQELFGIEPDLTIMGKIIGGGLPVGAYGGGRDLMEMVAPSGTVYQAGTLSGNPLAMAAGLAALRPLRDPLFYERLADTTETLAEWLETELLDARVPATVNRVCGMLTVFFTSNQVSSLEDAQSADAAMYARFFHEMLRRGVYLPPSQFEAWMISSAHTREVLEQVHPIMRESARALADQ